MVEMDTNAEKQGNGHIYAHWTEMGDFTLWAGGRRAREKRRSVYEHAVGFRHLATYSHQHSFCEFLASPS